MKPTEEKAKLVNILIREAIDHGGDVGGPYFVNGDNLYVAMSIYRDKVWGRDSGICICMNAEDSPYFASIEDEAVGQYKEIE